MALMSERQRRIVSLLAASPAPLTWGELAQELGVSVRTVQAEVARINGGGALIESSNRGYRLRRDPGDSAVVRDGLGGGATSSDPADAVLRVLARGLVTDEEGPTTEDLGELLFMSRTAVERVLGEVRERVSRQGLALSRTRGRISLTGDDDARRRLLSRLVVDEATGGPSAEGPAEPVSALLDLGFVRDLIGRCAHRENRYVEPGYETGLATSVAIALFRMRCPSGLARVEGGDAGDGVELRVADAVCAAYMRRWPIRACAEDVAQVASLLVGWMRPTQPGVPREARSRHVERDARVEDVVRDALAPYGISVEDGPALRGLVLHVDQLVRRSDGQSVTDDGLLEGVKRSCPFLFEVSQVVAKALSERLDVTVDESELGFLCIHLGLVVGELADNRPRVALLSTTYRSVDQALRDQLVMHFGDRASIRVFTRAAETLDEARAGSVDLVVTTRPLRGLPVPHVLISPLLLSDDLLAIGEALRHHARSGRLAQLRSTRPFFSEELFVRDDGATVRERDEVIDELCARLKAAGAVGAEFAASVRAREAAGSTCFFERFAIPHAIEMDARRTAFCVLTSRAGVCWGGPVIRVVLMIAVRREDRERFMSMFDSTVRALGTPELLPRLERARTLDDFLAALLDQ